MAIKHIKKDQTETVEIDGDGSAWVLNEGVKITVVGDDGIHNAFADRLDLTIEGTVSATDPNVVISAVRLAGLKNSLHVTETGKLTGVRAVNLEGDKAHIDNDGKIVSTSPAGTAIGGGSTGFDIENNGKIAGGNGIDLFGHGRLVNGEDGVISGVQAIRILGDIGSEFINHGRLLGTNWALIAGEGEDLLVNRGRMEGGVDMAGGADHIDLRRGTTLGNIGGGTGNDVFFIDNSHTEISEADDEGYDIVWTTASYSLEEQYSDFEVLAAKGTKNISLAGNAGNNQLGGNSGNNTLTGNGGEDKFYAGAGKDKLIGGADSDTFVFRKGDGHDTIVDFDVDGSDHDVLDLHFLHQFKTIDDVLAAAKEVGDGVVLKLGNGDRLTMDTATIGDIEIAEIIYAT